MPADTNPLISELEIKLGDAKTGFRTYIFKIPTVHDEMKVGIRMRAIRRMVSDGDDPTDDGLDGMTLLFNRACANFELLLLKSSETWPFSPGTGGPVVDSSKFPIDKVQELVDAQVEFVNKLTSFRQGGNPDQPSAVDQVASGQSDTGRSESV